MSTMLGLATTACASLKCVCASMDVPSMVTALKNQKFYVLQSILDCLKFNFAGVDLLNHNHHPIHVPLSTSTDAVRYMIESLL